MLLRKFVITTLLWCAIDLGHSLIFERYYSYYRTCPSLVTECVDLPRCPEIAWNFYHTTSLFSAVFVLKNNMCGINHGTIKVCCWKSLVIPNPHYNIINRERVVSRPSFQVTTPLPNVRDHPNFYLINRRCGKTFRDRITRGETAFLGEFPWMSILQYNVSGELKSLCGGSLITDLYVLTAAHCVTHNKNSSELVGVRLGEYDMSSENDCTTTRETRLCSDNPRDFQISEVMIHPEYNSSDDKQYANDIALIRLKTRVFPSEYIKPVCLPVPEQITTKNDGLSGLNLTVAGWGMTENSTESDILMKVNLPYVDSTLCSTRLKGRRILPGQLCAGGTMGRSACNGDSGGPLIATNVDTSISYQVGVVSIGFGNCLLFPSIYSNVEYYLPWILDNIRN